MYFISGSFFVMSSLIMFFFIDLYSRSYDLLMSDGDENLAKIFYGTGSIWFPIAAALIGLFLMSLHFITKEKSGTKSP